MEKDPFEVEDEEFEAELEEESAHSSESDGISSLFHRNCFMTHCVLVEVDSGLTLDPAALLSDKSTKTKEKLFQTDSVSFELFF